MWPDRSRMKNVCSDSTRMLAAVCASAAEHHSQSVSDFEVGRQRPGMHMVGCSEQKQLWLPPERQLAQGPPVPSAAVDTLPALMSSADSPSTTFQSSWMRLPVPPAPASPNRRALQESAWLQLGTPLPRLPRCAVLCCAAGRTLHVLAAWRGRLLPSSSSHLAVVCSPSLLRLCCCICTPQAPALPWL